MNRDAVADYMIEASQTKGVFGHLDCARFAVECHDKGFDTDLSRFLQYDDRRSAIERLRRSGGLQEAFTEVLGEMVPVDDLVEGDFAMLSDKTIGFVIEGVETYVAVKKRHSVYRMSIDTAIGGWKCHKR